MTRRVGAPGALAEQRGRGKRRGRLPRACKQGKTASQSASSSRGSSNGRTPALQVRQSRSESWPRDQETAESVAAQTTTGPLINHSGVSPSDQPTGTI